MCSVHYQELLYRQKMEQERKVLVCLGKRKRLVALSSDSEISDKKVLLKKIKSEFKDKLPKTDSYEILLQMKDKEFDEFIEVRESDKIEDKAILKLIVEEKEVCLLKCASLISFNRPFHRLLASTQ